MDTALLQNIAKNILKLRVTADLSQLQLATNADISLKTLHAIEHAAGNLEIITLTKIADALNVTVEQLFESEDTNSKLDSLIDLLSRNL